MRLLYMSENDGASTDLPEIYRKAIRDVADLTIISQNDPIELSDKLESIRTHDAYLVSRHSVPVPAEIASDAGELSYICADVGSLRAYVPGEVIRAGILTTNWGDAPAIHIAEGTMALLLAVMKDLHHHIRSKRAGGWRIDPAYHGGRLEGTHVGLYGVGVIGRAFIPMLRPFGAAIHYYDPYVEDLGDGLIRETSLEGLFTSCQIISIHAGLTDETRGSVTAELLSLLPKYGIIINTGRGAIIDQDALFRELESGRLRAGLDVLEPDTLPPDHPARSWENCILSSHQIHLKWPDEGREPTSLSRARRYLVENLRRVRNGEVPRFVVDETRYERMT